MTMTQLDMFADHRPANISAKADPDRVRRKLDALLTEAREAGLPSARRRFMETVVPQMTRWLPDEEAERVKRSFGEVLAG
jgi:hypothetical protein